MKQDEALAARITARLFINGQGQHAKRLVLELDNGRDGGGWCEQAVQDQIIAELKLTRRIKEQE